MNRAQLEHMHEVVLFAAQHKRQELEKALVGRGLIPRAPRQTLDKRADRRLQRQAGKAWREDVEYLQPRRDHGYCDEQVRRPRDTPVRVWEEMLFWQSSTSYEKVIMKTSKPRR
jgi:hypothetical protein